MSAFAADADETVAEHILFENPWTKCLFGNTDLQQRQAAFGGRQVRNDEFDFCPEEEEPDAS